MAAPAEDQVVAADQAPAMAAEVEWVEAAVQAGRVGVEVVERVAGEDLVEAVVAEASAEVELAAELALAHRESG